MKIKILYIAIFLSMSTSVCLAHKEPTHQYIVKEAYKYLKKLVGKITEMEAHIGNNEGRTMPFEATEPTIAETLESTIVAGAWKEDTWNPIRMTSAFDRVSTSHFWKPEFNKDLGWVEIKTPLWPDDRDQNAYLKIMKYAEGDWTWIIRKIQDPWTDNAFLEEYEYTDYYFRYYDLIDFYKTGNIKYIGKLHEEGEIILGSMWRTPPYMDLDGTGENINFESVTGWSTEDRIGLVYFLLGRMCHLLADMSLPVHAHNQQHALPRDLYENAMSVERYYPDGEDAYAGHSTPDNLNLLDHTWFPKEVSANSVFQNSGNLIDVFSCDQGLFYRTPLHFLMYTANQLSDHYADFENDGNDDVGGIRTFYEWLYATTLINAAGGPTAKTDYQSYYEFGPNIDISPPWIYVPLYENIPSLYNIRDNTFTHSITATASLLYWFAVQTGQLEGNSCNPDLYIQNTTFTQNPYTFISQNIHAGNHVDPLTPSIGHDAGDVVVSGGSAVIFRGSKSVSIMDGFLAKPVVDGAFHAFIQDCPSACEEEIDAIVNKGGSRDAVARNQVTGEYIGIDTIDLSSSNDKYIYATITLTENQVIDHSLSLSVHPNPATNIITLDYGLKSAGNITIGIYDQLGNLKQVIINNQPSGEGTYSVEHNTSKFESGTYYIRISNQHKVITQQIKIIK